MEVINYTKILHILKERTIIMGRYENINIERNRFKYSRNGSGRGRDYEKK